MTKDELHAGLVTCCQVYERALPSKETEAAYYSVLRMIPGAQWTKVVRRVIQTEDFFPRPSAFFRHYTPEPEKPKSVAALEVVGMEQITDERRQEIIQMIRNIADGLALGKSKEGGDKGGQSH